MIDTVFIGGEPTKVKYGSGKSCPTEITGKRGPTKGNNGVRPFVPATKINGGTKKPSSYPKSITGKRGPTKGNQ